MGDRDNYPSFLDAISAGQTFRTRKRQEAEAEEDRSVLKELLGHRLRTIKLAEKMDARKAAIENLNLMSGRPQGEIPEDQLEPVQPQVRPGEGPLEPAFQTPIQRQMKVQQVPGIEEYGTPGFGARPRTLEEEMVISRARARAALAGKTITAAAGSHVLSEEDPTQVLHRVPNRPVNPPAPHWMTRDNPDGTRTSFPMSAADVPPGGVNLGKPRDNALVGIEEQAGPGEPIVTTQVPRGEA